MFENYEAFVKENVKTFKYFDSIKDNIYTGEYFVAKSSVILSTFGGNERIRRWLKQIPLV